MLAPVSGRRVRASVVVIGLALAACSSGPGASSPGTASSSPAGGGGSTVEVKLQEWSVIPAATSAAAGSVTFKVTNSGPDDVHEFVILKTDLGPDALPTDANGAVNEAEPGMEVIDEIEDIPVGQAQDLTVSLAAGKYVLLCNIYSETEKEAHYKMGMRTGFTVN